MLLQTVIAIGIGPLTLFAQNQDAIAVVTDVEGTVRIPQTTRTLQRFDWLVSGSRVETGARSRAVLVFGDGRQFELLSQSAATVTPSGAERITGTARELTSYRPSAPTPISDSGRTRNRAAAIRLRTGSGASIHHLYPGGDAMSLADETVLQFDSAGEGLRYKVELENESGETVLETETSTCRVPVSPSLLKPAARYYWRVRVVPSVGDSIQGEAEFVTLGAKEIAQRARLKNAIREKSTGEISLLAEVDRRLGLFVEARDGFRLALQQSPENERLRASLREVEAYINASRPQE